MLVEFVNPNVNEAQTGVFPVIVNTGKPFELDDVAAKAYINEGFLKAATKKVETPKEEKK